MKEFTIKFHKVSRFTDPSGMFKTKIEIGMVGTEFIARLESSCEGFPTVKSILGPFNPTGIKELQDDLRKEEKNGTIKNLVFEQEIVLNGIMVEMSSEQIQMN